MTACGHVVPNGVPIATLALWRTRAAAVSVRGTSGFTRERRMPSRRTFLKVLAGSAVMPRVAFPIARQRPLALYANVGPVLTHYDVDVASATLIKRESVTLPAGVQYAWPDH